MPPYPQRGGRAPRGKTREIARTRGALDRPRQIFAPRLFLTKVWGIERFTKSLRFWHRTDFGQAQLDHRRWGMMGAADEREIAE